ncbi:MAG: LacI family DNA-binding transcriptional regulator [Bacillota bacterium]
MKKQLKLKEIASLANVSPATVSLVLNNREGVSSEKRRMIQEILEKNGYNINREFGLKTKKDVKKKSINFIKFKRHGLLVDGNPGFVNAIIDAVEKECRRQGHNLVMTAVGENQLGEVHRLIEQDSTDGVLLLGTELTEEYIQYFSNVPVPMVIIDNYMPMLECNCITMNNEEAIFRSVSLLASLNHPKIGFIANALPTNNCNARRMAYEYALVKHGYTFDPSLVYTVHPTPDGAYQSVRNMLEKGTKFPSALVANNDSIALGAMKAFKEYKIRIPEDISIVGFDGIPFSTISDPPLTTMEVSCLEIGVWAVRILCDRIQYPFSSITKMQVGTRLLERNSTAPYNPRRSNSHLL